MIHFDLTTPFKTVCLRSDSYFKSFVHNFDFDVITNFLSISISEIWSSGVMPWLHACKILNKCITVVFYMQTRSAKI